jgi:prevent-host-death family protein
MREITATKFKEHCLALLDDLDSEGLVITKRGKPVAKLIPINTCCAELIGSMKGKLVVKGDIFSTDEKWDAES